MTSRWSKGYLGGAGNTKTVNFLLRWGRQRLGEGEGGRGWGDSSVDTQYLTTALIQTTTSIITHHVPCSASLHHNEGLCSCTAWKGQGANGEGGQRLASNNDRHKNDMHSTLLPVQPKVPASGKRALGAIEKVCLR